MDWSPTKSSISIDRNMIQVLSTEAKFLIFKVNKKQFRQAYSHMEIIVWNTQLSYLIKGEKGHNLLYSTHWHRMF